MMDIEDLVSNFESGRQEKLRKWHGEEEVREIRRSLLAWYHQKRRKLPWRGDEYVIDGQTYERARSPYGTWVSEIMLQQTRVETVIPYWHRWMETFPDVATLAQASPDDVNKLWAGLGYYSRAQRLLQGAKDIMNKNNGEVPSAIDRLKGIAGIGPYTAGAIASIAFGVPTGLVDGNVIRLFSRMRAITAEDKGKDMENTAWYLSGEIVDPDDAGSFNQALMELGATLCKPTNPSCETCPVAEHCMANRLINHKVVTNSIVRMEKEEEGGDRVAIPDSVTAFPFKTPKKAPREIVLSVGVFVTRPQGQHGPEGALAKESDKCKFLFVKRPSWGLLQNQWEFPNVGLYEEEGRARGLFAAKAEKGNPEESAAPMGHEDVDISPNALWKPLPLFMNETLSWEWNKDLIPTLVPELMSAVTAALGDAGEASGRGEEGSDEKNSTSGVSGKRKGEDKQKGSDNLAPIVHVFSHQRHTMHITIKEVVVTCAGRGIEATGEVMPLIEGPVTGPVKRESKWMTAAEIREIGITSGCKKVLEAAERSLNGESGKANRKRSTAHISPVRDGKKEGVIESKKKSSKAKGMNEYDQGSKQAKISSFFAKK